MRKEVTGKYGDKVLWGLLMLILVVCYLSFRYSDVVITTDNSLLLLETITQGKLFEFYDYSVKNALICLADYEPPIYFIFAIWNLPLFVCEKAWGADVLYATGAILWTKLLVVLFVLGVARYIYKICELCEIEEKTKRGSVFLFLSSALVVFPSMVIEQYDCIALFFMVGGLYYYLKSDLKKFLIFFTIAIPLKMFALFIFFPLVLLRWKKIWQIAIYSIAGLLLLGICKVAFGNDPAYVFAIESFSKALMNRFLTCGFDFRYVIVNGFILCEVVLCVWAYVRKSVGKDLMYDAIYVCAASFGTFMIFYSFHAYWIIILMPFLILLIMQNGIMYRTNVLMLTVGEYVILLYLMMTQPQCFKPNILDNLLLVKIFGEVDENVRKYASPAELFSRYDLDFYVPFLYTIFMAIIIAILVFNFPKKKAVVVNDEIAEKEKSIFGARLLLLCLGIGIVIYCYFKTSNPIAINYSEMPVTTECNILDNNVVSQEISFEDDTELDELVLRFTNNARNQFLRSSLVISISNETNDIIFEKRIGTSILPTDEDYYIDLDGLQVYSGEEYVLEIQGMDGGDNICYIVGTDRLYESANPLKINGVEQDYNLYMIIR